MNDVKFAFRVLRTSPGFLIAAVLSLTLGIGAATTMFSAFRAVFLRPLPYLDPDRLVEIVKPIPEGGTLYPTVADADFLKQFSHSIERIGTSGGLRALTLSAGGEPVNANAHVVGRDLFPVLGTRPMLGRPFEPGDFDDAGPRSALLSFHLWKDALNGDAAVVGRRVMLDNESYTVIGVMPPEFQFPNAFYNMWIPDREKVTSPVDTRRTLVARLKPGVDLQSAQAEMARMLPALVKQYPAARSHFRIRLDSLSDRDRVKYRAAFLMLCGAVGLLLLIACLNVANLIIARSVARETEFAIRSALGAGRARLIRQVLVESLVLAAAGGAIGGFLAYGGNRALVAWLPANQIARLNETRIDSTVLAFAIAATTFTALAFGTGPALVLSKLSMREHGRTATHGADRVRWRAGLVVAEIALSLSLLVGAGLLIRSFVALAAVDPGFRPEHMLTVTIPASAQMSKDKPQLVRRLTGILERAQAVPGVTAAGLATAIPMGEINVSLSFELPGHKGEELPVTYRAVSTDYFRAMGMSLRLGRLPEPGDDAEGAPSIGIVNEAFVRKYWPGQYPIGQKLTGRDLTVVGVVADTHSHLLSGPAEPELYCPYRQYLGPAPGATLVLRTRGDPATMAAALRQAIRENYPDQPIADVVTMETRLARSMAEPRLYAILVGVFAAVALALTAVGIYGAVSYSVGNRAREFGIRMALGAGPEGLVRFVMRGSLGIIVVGLAAGLAGAWVLSRFVASMLFQVNPRDPFAFAVAPLVLLVVAAAACYMPARRASRIDPGIALRQE